MVTCPNCRGAGSYYSTLKGKVIECPECYGDGEVEKEKKQKSKFGGVF